jgi:hypothetical protein
MKLIKHLREVILKERGNTITQVNAVLDESTAVLSELGECAHSRGFRQRGSQFVHVPGKDIGLDMGITGVIFGAGVDEGFADLGDSGWVDGKEDEVIVFA